MEREGRDRREAPRAACRLSCTIATGVERVRARVVDVSEGGLCALAQVYLEPRRTVDVAIEMPGSQGPALVRAQVWHVRREGLRATRRRIWVVGMMLEEVDDAYRLLLRSTGVARSAGGTREGAAHTAASAESGGGRTGAAVDPVDPTLPASSDDQAIAAARAFRIRVKATDGPRTRLLTLSAASAGEARRLAERDLSGQWSILDVYPR